MIALLLKADPAQRPTAAQILRMPAVLKRMESRHLFDIEKEETNELLKTIYAPSNINYLRYVLPPANYSPVKVRYRDKSEEISKSLTKNPGIKFRSDSEQKEVENLDYFNTDRVREESRRLTESLIVTHKLPVILTRRPRETVLQRSLRMKTSELSDFLKDSHIINKSRERENMSTLKSIDLLQNHGQDTGRESCKQTLDSLYIPSNFEVNREPKESFVQKESFVTKKNVKLHSLITKRVEKPNRYVSLDQPRRQTIDASSTEESFEERMISFHPRKPLYKEGFSDYYGVRRPEIKKKTQREQPSEELSTRRMRLERVDVSTILNEKKKNDLYRSLRVSREASSKNLELSTDLPLDKSRNLAV